MIISQRAWDQYIAALRKINDAAYQAMMDYIERYGFPTERWQQDAMIDIAEAIVNKYGDASATLAAEFYDTIGALAGRTLPPAVPADPATTEEIARAVVGTAKSGNPDIVSGAVGRLVKMQGVDTTMQNAIRDGAEWAWIPRGDTCAFCIALASRGWQEASKKALKGGHAEHIHANCDCTYAIRFDSSSNVAGYDPDAYLEMWYDADGRNSDRKLNSLRRSLYAENREKILAQKRSAYEKSKELESSAAEEADL